MCEQAHRYCSLGATNDDLAGFFAVSPATVDRWIARHADFARAVKRGRIVADARVAAKLHQAAVGYERTVERTVLVGGTLKRLATTVHHPPSVRACIFWLRHRRPATWGDARAGTAAHDGRSDMAWSEPDGEGVRHHAPD
jgi:hypothetical protein